MTRMGKRMKNQGQEPEETEGGAYPLRERMHKELQDKSCGKKGSPVIQKLVGRILGKTGDRGGQIRMATFNAALDLALEKEALGLLRNEVHSSLGGAMILEVVRRGKRERTVRFLAEVSLRSTMTRNASHILMALLRVDPELFLDQFDSLFQYLEVKEREGILRDACLYPRPDCARRILDSALFDRRALWEILDMVIFSGGNEKVLELLLDRGAHHEAPPRRFDAGFSQSCLFGRDGMAARLARNGARPRAEMMRILDRERRGSFFSIWLKALCSKELEGVIRKRHGTRRKFIQKAFSGTPSADFDSEVVSMLDEAGIYRNTQVRLP